MKKGILALSLLLFSSLSYGQLKVFSKQFAGVVKTKDTTNGQGDGTSPLSFEVNKLISGSYQVVVQAGDRKEIFTPIFQETAFMEQVKKAIEKLPDVDTASLDTATAQIKESYIKLLELVFQADGYSPLAVTDANGCSATSGAVNITTVGIEDVSYSDVGFKIYPNPATTDLMIECDEEMASVQVADVLGRVVITQSNLATHNLQLATDFLAEAAYFIHIKTYSGKTAVKRFVKQ